MVFFVFHYDLTCIVCTLLTNAQASVLQLKQQIQKPKKNLKVG